MDGASALAGGGLSAGFWQATASTVMAQAQSIRPILTAVRVCMALSRKVIATGVIPCFDAPGWRRFLGFAKSCGSGHRKACGSGQGF